MPTQVARRVPRPPAVAVAAFLLASVVAARTAGAPQEAPAPQQPAAPAETHPGHEAAGAGDASALEPRSAPQEAHGSEDGVEATVAEPVSGPPPASDLERAQATMGHLLITGRALHAWVRDTRLERGRKTQASKAPPELRWDRCPPIDHRELLGLLVPAYLRDLPEVDAWGRPLQFCLDRRLAAPHQQYGVRSPGSDGVFSGDRYQTGGFPESRLDGDLVWMDGSFVRWAQPQ